MTLTSPCNRKATGLFLVILTLLILAPVDANGHCRSRPKFCGGTCHAMRVANNTWSHCEYKDVACIDCHFTMDGSPGPAHEPRLRQRLPGISRVLANLPTPGAPACKRIAVAHEACTRPGGHGGIEFSGTSNGMDTGANKASAQAGFSLVRIPMCRAASERRAPPPIAIGVDGMRLSIDKSSAADFFVLRIALGNRNRTGENAVRNYAEAVRRHRIAKKRGSAAARANLAAMYEQGLGIGRDDEKTARWYRLAAECGEANAQHRLGQMHAEGLGAPQDLCRAEMRLRAVAEQSHDEAIAAPGQDKQGAEIRPPARKDPFVAVPRSLSGDMEATRCLPAQGLMPVLYSVFDATGRSNSVLPEADSIRT